MNNDLVLSASFFSEIKSILSEARKSAYFSVNLIMVQAYWKIGQRIVKEEQSGKNRADYGSFLIRELSKQLGEEFGKGFSIANLKNFRQFYLTFPDFEKSYALCSHLSWSHYRLIMRHENPKARDYYIKEASEQNWSTRQLERNISSMYFERLLSSSEEDQSLKPDLPARTDNLNKGEFIKDPYVLEFLGLPEHGGERESILESAIIAKLQNFLLELGKGFSFVGRQFRISTETSHFCLGLKSSGMNNCKEYPDITFTDLKLPKINSNFESSNGNFRLYVSNQSTDIIATDIKVCY